MRPVICPAQTSVTERFYQANRNDNAAALGALLESQDVNAKDSRGATPLMYAAAFGNARQMKLLLESGADVNAQNAFHATALIWAAGDAVKSRMLIEHGADVNVRSQQGRTPLWRPRNETATPSWSVCCSRRARPWRLLTIRC
ncbi:MAG: ankyrin repeat domain-containing protein [Acidobacteriia bacterium]|nr:ankyrin repeat domain-containing protein [Terriglobia bacterium]